MPTRPEPPTRPATHLSRPPQLAKEFEKGIPVQEDVLLPRLRQLLISEFGAKPRQPAPAPAAPPAAGEPVGAA